MKKPHRYTQEERRFLYDTVPGHSYAEIMTLFNATFEEPITVNQVKAFIKNNHLNTGRTGQFQKGNIPFNKGKHGSQYGYPPTQFKRGQTPINHKPVGSRRIDVDGYTLVKVAEPNKWRGLHSVMWEEAYGSIPKGHVVIFGDGDKRNITLDNLLLVSRAELAVINRNGLLGASVELTKTGVLVADLLIKMRSKYKNTKNQNAEGGSDA